MCPTFVAWMSGANAEMVPHALAPSAPQVESAEARPLWHDGARHRHPEGR